jgi:predicted metal-dependent enzyme (double-stranded beta helix superfamily)
MIARALDGELLALSVGDPRNAYGRTVLRAGPEVEVMVARWTPGRGCAPHDHGGSTGVVRVLQGEATHVWYHIQDGALVEVGQERAGAGDLLLVDPALIHAMRPADGVPLVTLHLYAAPIASMAVFDCHAKRSLRVTGRSGAWIPDDPSLILRELPGIALPPPE